MAGNGPDGNTGRAVCVNADGGGTLQPHQGAVWVTHVTKSTEGRGCESTRVCVTIQVKADGIRLVKHHGGAIRHVECEKEWGGAYSAIRKLELMVELVVADRADHGCWAYRALSLCGSTSSTRATK